MPSTIQPVIISPDLERLLLFYSSLFGATETMRHPEDGRPFYVRLQIADSELGIVSNAEVSLDGPGRLLLSIEVADVDGLLPRVTELGGTVQGPPNDMPWGQRVAHIADPDGNDVNLTRSL